MFITQANLAAHPQLAAHRAELVAHRNMFRVATDNMLAANHAHMTPHMLAINALAGISREYWQQVDSQIIEMRDQEIGMEILTDILRVQTVLDIGKTASMYNVVGDIADDVAVSIDGQAPYSFDHTEFGSDGDPIPMFTAGYGVNWRHQRGLATVGIDLVLQSQAAKLRKFNQKLVSYTLDGTSRISVQGMPGQGLRNHRNTSKIDLGAGGANIDLTTATQAELSAFFSTGAFGQNARTNKVAAYDVLWVSPQIWGNLSKQAATVIAGSTILSDRSVLQVIAPFIPAREVRQSFALVGNEFLGYVRSRDIVTPLVGMATGTVPLPRFMPQDNYNFQIMAAMGIRVTRDDEGLSGVVYGADLG